MIYTEFIIGFLIGGVVGFLGAWFLKKSGKIEEDSFKTIATDVLRQTQGDFLAQASDKFKTTESSVKDLVDSVKKRVDELENKRSEQVGQLKAGIDQILAVGQEMKTSATTLKTALTSSGTVLGKWGEAQLVNLLEKAGMAKGTDFDFQETVAGEGSATLRPDFIIHIPGGMTLAVDSKASSSSLYEFERAIGEKPEEKTKHIASLVVGLRQKIRDLSGREYQKHVDPKIPYVVMFIPIESALMAALQYDSGLYTEAQDRKVMLASRSIIVPLILLIRSGQEQYRTGENVGKINNEIAELKNRLETFFDHFSEIGSNISKTAGKFNEAVGSFESRVRPELGKINELGSNLPLGEKIKKVEMEPRALRKLSEKV